MMLVKTAPSKIVQSNWSIQNKNFAPQPFSTNTKSLSKNLAQNSEINNLIELRRIAQSIGSSIDSKQVYQNEFEPIKLHCYSCETYNKHNSDKEQYKTEFELTPSQLREGIRCRDCCERNSDIEQKERESRIQFRKGKILNPEVSDNGFLFVQCQQDHKFYLFLDEVSFERWCPECLKQIESQFIGAANVRDNMGEFMPINIWKHKFRSSNGEKTIGTLLNDLGLLFIREHIINCLPRRRYDFLVQDYNKKLVLLEHDGEQHFDLEHMNELNQDQVSKEQIDIYKTYCPIQLNNYRVIRIDWTTLSKSLDKTKEFLLASLKSTESICVSDKRMYEYLLKSVPPFDHSKQFCEMATNQVNLPENKCVKTVVTPQQHPFISQSNKRHFSLVETNRNFAQNTRNKTVCFKCGRFGHYSNNCYAKTNVTGESLKESSDEYEEDITTIQYFQKSKPKNILCFNCGRPGHYSNNCYAKIHVVAHDFQESSEEEYDEDD